MPITYAFGWRRQKPDSRDLRWAAPAHILAALPAKVDLDTPSPGAPFDPAWDQSNIGCCGPNTMGENLTWDELQAKSGPAVQPSRLYMYYNTRALMGTIGTDSGVDNRTMLKALNQYGWCDESLWPYDTSKFTQQPPQSCYDQAATRISGIQYEAVAQDLQTMQACLVARKPIIFGFTVFQSMMSPDVAQSGDVPMPNRLRVIDPVVGGHDVLIVGYDTATQRFKFKNHWTPQWGKNGYGTIPFAYALNPRLAGDFWTVTRTGIGASPMPTPTPSPAPTPGGSQIQQLVDQLFVFLEAQAPSLTPVIEYIRGKVDDWIHQHNLLSAQPSQLQSIVDAVFASVKVAAQALPIFERIPALFAINELQSLVDSWMQGHNLLAA